jgi:acetyltransferase-like isoleucine patch superfamily enzyme
VAEDPAGNLFDVSRLPLGIDKTKEIRMFALCELQKTQNIQHIDKIMPWSNATYRQIISREFLVKHSLKFSRAMIGEDHEFSLDLLAKNPRLQFFSSITYKHVLHPNSISRSLSKSLLIELLSSLQSIKRKVSILPENAFKEGVSSFYSNIGFIAPYANLRTFSGSIIRILGLKPTLKLYFFKLSGKSKYEIKKFLSLLKVHYLLNIAVRIQSILRRFGRSRSSGYLPPITGFHPLGEFEASKRITCGTNVHCESGISFERGVGHLEIGSNTSIGSGTIIISQDEGIIIGENCLISWNVLITDSDTHLTNSMRISDARDWNIGLRTGRRGEYKEWHGVRCAPVKIGNNVWIGYGAVILPGVSIGDNAIIGASSVVTKNVEPGSTVAGNPASLISVK